MGQLNSVKGETRYKWGQTCPIRVMATHGSVVGHTPAHAVAAGNCGGYTIFDLNWDLKHGYLVVPNLESTANPNPEADAFAEAGRAQTARRPGNIEHYLPHQYWTIKQSGGRVQGGMQVHDIGGVAGCLFPDYWRRAAAESSARGHNAPGGKGQVQEGSA